MIYPALPTPFDAAGRPDWGAYQETMDRLAGQVDGFLIFGSNGEAPLLFPEEREEGLSRLKPPKRFLVGVGDESLTQARRHQEAARHAGAEAGLAYLPRFFFAQLDEAAALRYFEGLAELHPVWIYHVPSLTRTELPLAWVERIAAIPGVVGVKDSSGEMARIVAYDAAGIGLPVFTGSAAIFAPALIHGAQGGVLAAANLVPGLLKEIEAAVASGRLEKARRLQNRLWPLARLLSRGGVTLLKQAMRSLGIPAGFPRPPLPAESPLFKELSPLLEAFKAEGYLV